MPKRVIIRTDPPLNIETSTDLKKLSVILTTFTGRDCPAEMKSGSDPIGSFISFMSNVDLDKVSGETLYFKGSKLLFPRSRNRAQSHPDSNT